jgi:hypothetical protein
MARSRLAARRGRLDVAAAEALEALRRDGIDALVLKGPALAAALYDADEERGYFDVDLLVAPEHRAAAGAVLSGLGYQDVSGDIGVDDVAGILHAEMWSRIDEEIGNITIDLHWKLDGCKASAEACWRAVSAARSEISVAGRPAAALGPPAMALHVALHVAQHGPDDAKAVSDLRRALDRWPLPLWLEAARLAREVEAQEGFAAGLRLIPEGSRMADTLGAGSGERALWDIEHRDSRPRGTFHLEAFNAATTWRQRLDVIRRALLPSPRWISWEMRWATRSPLHLGAAYLAHVLRTPVWALRASRFRRSRPR